MEYGPYLVFIEGNPSCWCYFEIKSSQMRYYTSPYPCVEEHPRWQKSQFPRVLHVIAPQTEGFTQLCFLENENGFYQGKLSKSPTHPDSLMLRYAQSYQINENHLTLGAPQRLSENHIIPNYHISNEIRVPTLPSQTNDETLSMPEMHTSNLSKEQQGTIRNTIAVDWPLKANMPYEEQLLVLNAILTEKPILSKPDLESIAQTFRHYLFPAWISMQFAQDKTTVIHAPIGHVRDYIAGLINQAITELGGQPITLPELPSEIAEILCGELPKKEGFLTLYSGLKTHENQLFDLIMRQETQGWETLTFDEWIQIYSAVNAILNHHFESPELQALENTLNLSQNQDKVRTICRTKLDSIYTQMFKHFIALPVQDQLHIPAEIPQDFHSLFALVYQLKKEGFCTTPENINALINDIFILKGLDLCSSANILEPGLISGMIACSGHEENQDLCFVLMTSFKMKALTREHFFRIVKCDDITLLAHTLNLLAQTQLLTTDNFLKIIHLANISNEFFYTLQLLAATHLLTQENFNITLQQDVFFLSILPFLFKYKLLTQEHLQLLSSHPEKECLYQICHAFEKSKLFTKDNFALVMSQHHLAPIADKIMHIEYLTQEAIDQLMPPILTSGENRNIFFLPQETENPEDKEKIPKNNPK